MTIDAHARAKGEKAVALNLEQARASVVRAARRVEEKLARQAEAGLWDVMRLAVPKPPSRPPF